MGNDDASRIDETPDTETNLAESTRPLTMRSDNLEFSSENRKPEFKHYDVIRNGRTGTKGVIKAIGRTVEPSYQIDLDSSDSLIRSHM